MCVCVPGRECDLGVSLELDVLCAFWLGGVALPVLPSPSLIVSCSSFFLALRLMPTQSRAGVPGANKQMNEADKKWRKEWRLVDARGSCTYTKCRQGVEFLPYQCNDVVRYGMPTRRGPRKQKGERIRYIENEERGGGTTEQGIRMGPVSVMRAARAQIRETESAATPLRDPG